MNPDEVKRRFWKNLPYDFAMYGGDSPGSLMGGGVKGKDEAGGGVSTWNLNKCCSFSSVSSSSLFHFMSLSLPPLNSRPTSLGSLLDLLGEQGAAGSPSAKSTKIPGVDKPFLYFGMWKVRLFLTHKEFQLHTFTQHRHIHTYTHTRACIHACTHAHMLVDSKAPWTLWLVQLSSVGWSRIHISLKRKRLCKPPYISISILSHVPHL